MDSLEEMRSHLDAQRVAHEDDAIRATLREYIVTGDKLDSQFNWLMAGTGAAIVFLLTQWTQLLSAIGHRAAILILALLALAILCGLVARLEIYQARLIADVWGTLPSKLIDIRATYAAEITNYFTAQQAMGHRQLPVPVDLNADRVISDVRRFMPPDFNTGWRKPVWWFMTKVALAVTGHGPRHEDVKMEWFNMAQSAYRVGSAYWLLIFYEVILIAAGLLGLVALALH
jgi:hypothetical protein